TGMNGVTIVWDVVNARKKWSVAAKHEFPGASAFDPSGRQVAASGKSGPVELLDAETGEPRGILSEDTKSTRGLVFSAGGGTVAVLKDRLLSFASVAHPSNAPSGEIPYVSGVALDRSGRWAAAVPAGAQVGRLSRQGNPRQVTIPEPLEKTCVALA